MSLSCNRLERFVSLLISYKLSYLFVRLITGRFFLLLQFNVFLIPTSLSWHTAPFSSSSSSPSLGFDKPWTYCISLVGSSDAKWARNCLFLEYENKYYKYGVIINKTTNIWVINPLYLSLLLEKNEKDCGFCRVVNIIDSPTLCAMLFIKASIKISYTVLRF